MTLLIVPFCPRPCLLAPLRQRRPLPPVVHAAAEQRVQRVGHRAERPDWRGGEEGKLGGPSSTELERGKYLRVC